MTDDRRLARDLADVTAWLCEERPDWAGALAVWRTADQPPGEAQWLSLVTTPAAAHLEPTYRQAQRALEALGWTFRHRTLDGYQVRGPEAAELSGHARLAGWGRVEAALRRARIARETGADAEDGSVGGAPSRRPGEEPS